MQHLEAQQFYVTDIFTFLFLVDTNWFSQLLYKTYVYRRGVAQDGSVSSSRRPEADVTLHPWPDSFSPTHAHRDPPGSSPDSQPPPASAAVSPSGPHAQPCWRSQSHLHPLCELHRLCRPRRLPPPHRLHNRSLGWVLCSVTQTFLLGLQVS